MVVLHVLTSLDPKLGGVCLAVRNIIKYATNKETIHEVVCLDQLGSAHSQNDNFTVHALGNRTSSWSYNPNLKKWLAENLQKYDRVVVHGLWQYQSYAVLKTWEPFKRLGSKLYIMPHGMLDPYFQLAKSRKVKAIRNKLVWKLIEKHLINNADGILFTTQIEVALAKTTFRGYKPQAELLVGLGVEMPPPFVMDMEDKLYEACPEVKDQAYILFLGRLNSKKGVDLLINAYLTLKRNYVKLPLLLIAGPGLETDFGQELLKLSDQEKDIIFCGMLSGDAKWGAFYKAEAFILPSHQENFGIAIVEAMACGVPVLITNQINIYQEIEDHGAGIVEEDNYDGILKMLLMWSQTSEGNRQEFSDNAKNAYKTLYTPEIAGQNFLSTIQ